MNIVKLTWNDIYLAIKELESKIDFKQYDYIIGVARGGVVPATILSYRHNKELNFIGVKSYTNNRTSDGSIESYIELPMELETSNKCLLFIDDLSDTGNTINFINTTYSPETCVINTAVLYEKTKTKVKATFYGEAVDSDLWLEFPWER